MQVSTLILTYNEEINIAACLDALAWCDDICIIDSGSKDATLEIAARYPQVRILHRPFDNFAGQRNFGLDKAEFRHEWVLHLDADEVLTEEFIAALRALEPPPGIHAYHVPAKMMLYGSWLRHAGMWPGYQVRLGDRKLRFKQVGHGQREDLPADQVATFGEAYLHYSFSHGLLRWFEKHIRYARDEAQLIVNLRRGEDAGGADPAEGDLGGVSRRRKAKQLAAHIPLWLRPVARFFYVYLVRAGFRDGRSGLIYTLMLCVYEGMTAVFAYDLMLRGQGKRKP